MMIPTAIEIDGKKGVIKEIYITELEYLMVLVFFPEEKRQIRFNLGKYNDVLPLHKIHNLYQNAETSNENRN